jgi:flagellar motility protein MotE (MotC chaperone)
MRELTYEALNFLRQGHPAWRLLRSDHAPLIVSFFQKAFVAPNARLAAEADLVESLEDELYSLRERLGEAAFPKAAREYLNDWAAPEKGWLRKYYRTGSDEPYFELAPATERAIAWLNSLESRSFVGTESRLLTLFDLLRQMAEGTETDPQTRIAELQRRRDLIDAEMAQVLEGNVPLLDDTAVRDRFQQFTQMARELLADFREVEQNFRQLDRRVRERIALWEGGKAALLEEIMGERDAISDSDQGKSFHAFWDFLMSSRRQEELTGLLEKVLEHPAIHASQPDPRLRRIHYDWLEAGEHTQRMVAELSRQLRRFLDDQAWLENRRIMDLLRGIEGKSLALRENPPSGAFMEIHETASSIELPFERPLFKTAFKPSLTNTILAATGEDIDAAALFAQAVVDKAALSRHIRQFLQDRSQVTLGQLVERRPLEHGLAEVVAYLDLGSGRFKAAIDETAEETLSWEAADAEGREIQRTARLPRVIFVR